MSNSTTHVYITDLSAFLPNAAVTNEDMEKRLGMVNNKASKARRVILRMNGILKRYYAIDPKTNLQSHSNADMTAAAIQMLKGDNYSVNQIECISTGTSSPDQLLPGHSVMVHGLLKNPPCDVMSAAGVCVSGMQAMKYAYLNVLTGSCNNAVAAGSEIASAGMKGSQFEGEISERIEEMEKKPVLAFEKDFLRWMLSDGAGAALLQNTPNREGISLRIEYIDIFSFANEQPVCMYMGGVVNEKHELTGFRNFDYDELKRDSVLAIKQDTRILNNNIITTCVDGLSKFVEKRKINCDEINYILPHLSSHWFGDQLDNEIQSRGFNLPRERWFTNLSDVGNVGAASIYLMLEALRATGKLKVGDKLLLIVPESGRFTMCYTVLTVVGPEG